MTRLRERVDRMPYSKWRVVEQVIEAVLTALFVIGGFALDMMPSWIMFAVAGVLCLGLLWRICHDKLRW